MFLRNYLPSFTTTTENKTTVEEDLALFKKNWGALKSVDQKIGIAGGIDALLWLTSGGLIHMLFNAAITVAIYFYVTEHAKRNEKASNFQLQLHKLVNHYRSYRDSDPKITNDPTFKNVLEAIAPFVSTEELLLWDLNNTRSKDLSAEYIETLAKPPHNLKLVMVGGPHTTVSSNPENVYKQYFNLFTQTAKRVCYGHREPSQEQTNQAKTHWATPR